MWRGETPLTVTKRNSLISYGSPSWAKDMDKAGSDSGEDSGGRATELWVTHDIGMGKAPRLMRYTGA